MLMTPAEREKVYLKLAEPAPSPVNVVPQVDKISARAWFCMDTLRREVL
jgi:hypothetical protein